MQNAQKRWVAVLLGVLVVVGVGWYVMREVPVGSRTDAGVQRGVDAAVAGGPVVLAEVTGFEWDRVQVFAYGTGDGEISAAVGDAVEWKVAATSYSGPSLWVFSKGGEVVRAVQLDANVPKGKGSWSSGVRVSGGSGRNVVTLVE